MSKKFYKKASFWTALSQLTIFIFFIGFFTGIITPEFYKLGTFLVIPGTLSTLYFIIKMIKDK